MDTSFYIVALKERQGTTMKKMNMKKMTGFIFMTVMLVLVSAFCITGTVMSQSTQAAAENEAYFLSLERAYVKEMRQYLQDAGFRNTGVMLTRTIDEDGVREYEATIHNSRFDRLTEEERAALVQELAGLAFEEEKCSFTYSLEGNA